MRHPAPSSRKQLFSKLIWTEKLTVRDPLKRLRNFVRWIPAFAGMTAYLMALPALAEDPSTYAPEHCEFSITFPGDPYKTRRCDENDGGKCYDQITYTQVYDLATTVNFRTICNEINSNVRETYSGEIMEATLKAMTKDTVVKTFETSFREEDGYKQAGLVGEGKVGRTPTIYIGQLWIGEKSALSVEAELIGNANEEADTLFSDVLKSVHYKPDREQSEEPEEPQETEEPTAETPSSGPQQPAP